MAKFEVPGGWTAQAYRFALDPSPAQERAFRSHAGAARKAYNTMLGLVKAVTGQRAAERSYGIAEAGLTPALNWSLAGLRKEWNRRKEEVAPWWAENSKEAYNTGLDALARGLDAWSKSRKGQRAGAAVGFPVFKSARSRRSVRFTTGAIRVEADRHHVTLPRVGTIRTHESTRKLARHIEAGTARILSATLAEGSSGRWFCSFQVIVRRCVSVPGRAGAGVPAVGVDVGVKAGSLLVIAAPDGRETGRVPAPKSLAQQHQIITVETLNASGMRSSGGARKRGLNRALADAALAEVRRMLRYKCTWYGSILVEASRYFPSSKLCSACGRRKPNLTLADRMYECDHCSLRIDRDLNAAVNLARLGEARQLMLAGEQGPAGSGPVAGRGATRETEPARAGDAGGRETSTPRRRQPGKTGTASPQGEAA